MHMLIALVLADEAQQVLPQPAEPASAVSLDRIRRGLEEPLSTVTVLSTDPTLPPIFRMDIKERPLPYEHLWQGDSISAHVRPVRGLTHHEFLEQVTPDLFRSTSMYPCCPVLPLLAKLRKTGPDKNAEAKARLQVKKELQELLESNTRSATPTPSVSK